MKKIFLAILINLFALSSHADGHKIHMLKVNDYVVDLEPTKDFTTLRHWNDVLKREPVTSGIGVVTWSKVRRINDECNVKEYKADSKWHTPTEFAHNSSGDCKGMSICKYYALRKAGIAPSQINIWSGDYNHQSHMAVTVKIGSEVRVLDIGAESNLPLPENYFFKKFEPTYRFNENGWDVN